AQDGLQHTQVIKRGREGRKEYRHRQDLKDENEADCPLLARPGGQRPEEKRRTALRHTEQRQHGVVEPEENSMRTGELEYQQSDHELQSHSPCDGLPSDLSAVGGKKPGDAGEREETGRGNEVMNHCFLANSLICV